MIASVYLIRCLIERNELELMRFGTAIPLDRDKRERWQRHRARLANELIEFQRRLKAAGDHSRAKGRIS